MKNKILAVVVACAMLLAILLGFIWQGKNDAFSNPRKPVETISLNDWVKLREMLQNKQFNELNSVLDGYQRLFELNHVDEYRIYDSFLAFRTTSPSYENLIQEWLEATPDQYQPYLGIAEYYYAKAWQSRGEKYAKDTSSEQFLGMNFYLQKAHENLTIALELNPHLMIAYNMLLGMSMAVGDSETEDEIIEKTSEMFPASFLIKYTALSAKEPQWGGSYEEMRDIATQTTKYSDKNPLLNTLPGFIYRYQAGLLSKQKKYDQALQLYQRAISCGEHYLFYYDRACLYYYGLKDYIHAFEDINRSIKLRPLIADNHLLRSKIYFQQGNYEESLGDIRTIEILKPGYSYAAKMVEWASRKLVNAGYKIIETDPEQAIKLFNFSMKYNINNHESYYFRGVTYNHQGKSKLALADFKQTIQINPHHFYAYESIGHVLARSGKWEQIIEYWNALIAIEPENEAAYFERSGAYYHIKKMENAIEDLKRACDLGSVSACQKLAHVPSK